MKDKISNLIKILAIALVPTFLIWIPFFARTPSFWHVRLPQTGLAAVVSNYDGPLYLIVAKTLYNKELIKTNYQFPLPTEYYPAHLPLFPLLIRAFSFITNYPYAMILVTLISSGIAIYFFNLLIRKFVSNSKDVWFLTFLFSVFPARWLIVRSVGSPDPLFVGAIIASVFYFKEKKYWAAGIWGAIAQLTKSPGILLFISYLIFLALPLIKNKFNITMNKIVEAVNFKKSYPLLLIPIALVSVFVLYWYVQGDFLAYFHSGDNIHLTFPPFQIFDYTAPWVGTFWLEEIIFIFLFGALGVIKLFDKKEFEMAIFSGVFFVLTLFVAHRDLMRYFLPVVPFLFLAFADTLVKREFKMAFAVIIIPIYLFSLAFISQNVMPISNWAPFL